MVVYGGPKYAYENNNFGEKSVFWATKLDLCRFFFHIKKRFSFT